MQSIEKTTKIQDCSHKHEKVHLASDRVGIALSIVCMIHCLATPLLMLIVPTLFQVTNHGLFHQIMLVLVVPVAIKAFYGSYKVHNNSKLLFAGFAGVGLLFLGVIIPELLHHSELGERIELSLTVLGGITLSVSHYINIKQCH
ncbi:MAG: MerC domain-containing protein [Bdellovibrionales bacterium]